MLTCYIPGLLKQQNTLNSSTNAATNTEVITTPVMDGSSSQTQSSLFSGNKEMYTTISYAPKLRLK